MCAAARATQRKSNPRTKPQTPLGTLNPQAQEHQRHPAQFRKATRLQEREAQRRKREKGSPTKTQTHRGAHTKEIRKAKPAYTPQKGLRPLWIPPPTGRCPFGFPNRNQFLYFCRFALGCRQSLAAFLGKRSKKGCRSSRSAAADPSSLGHLGRKEGKRGKKGEYKKNYTSASPLTRKLTRTGWSSLRSLQPYPPMRPPIASARRARSPRGGKWFLFQKGRKNCNPYI